MKKCSENGTTPPKYERVVDFIVRNIRNGIYPDGSHLPSESTLANELGISRATVREALSLICKRNIITKSQGRRSVINAAALRGRPQTLRFGWISRDPLARVMPVYLEIYTALQKTLLGINGNLLFLPLMNPQEEEWGCSMLDTLDGVFLAGVRRSTLIPRLAERLEAMPNVIEIDDIGDTPAACTVCTDNYLAGKMAAEYLAERNRRTVVFVSSRSAFYRGFHDRIRGVIDGFAEKGATPYLVNCDDSLIGTEEFAGLLTSLLHEFPNFDTVWHATDDAALRIRHQLEELAPRREGFYRSAGVDGIPAVLAGKNYHLSLRHPTAEIARLAFRIMIGFTAGERPERSLHLIAPIPLPWTETPETVQPSDIPNQGVCTL